MGIDNGSRGNFSLIGNQEQEEDKVLLGFGSRRHGDIDFLQFDPLTDILAPIRDPLENISKWGPSSVVCKDIKGSCDGEQNKETDEVRKRNLSSLFGEKLGDKSTIPHVTSKSCWEKGDFQIFVLDSIVDCSISSMELTLVEKFLGA